MTGMAKTRLPPPRHVTIAVGCAVVSGRNNIAGILRYINSGRRWNIEFVQNFDRLTDTDIRRIVDSGTDGLILGLPEAEAALPVLMRSPVPTVVTVQPETLPIPIEESRATVFVDVDNTTIGVKAATHLLERGSFRSFAFVSNHPDFRWSILRRDAFVAHLSARGRAVHVFEYGGAHGDGDMDAEARARFLGGLKHPAAVFAAYDAVALRVVETCQRHRISVPRQIAVLGVALVVPTWTTPALITGPRASTTVPLRTTRCWACSEVQSSKADRITPVSLLNEE